MAYVIIALILINLVVPFIKRKRKLLLAGMSVLTVFYIVWVFYITLFSRTENPALGVSLIPFSSFFSMIYNPWFGSGEYIAANIVGNTLLLAPVGMYGANFIRIKRIRLVAGIGGFLLSLCIEVNQLVYSLGVFEVDDLICNTWGCMIGVCIIQLLKEIVENRKIDFHKSIRLVLPGIIHAGLLGVMSMISLLRCF